LSYVSQQLPIWKVEGGRRRLKKVEEAMVRIADSFLGITSIRKKISFWKETASMFLE